MSSRPISSISESVRRHMGLPHPSLFTKGSKWRFHTRRRIYGATQSFEEGEEFTVITPFNNTTPVLAIGSKTIFEFRSKGHVTFYGKTQGVTATLNYNEIYRFVERIEAGTDTIYYIRDVRNKRFWTGKEDNDHHDFSMAQYWECEKRALKKLMKLNRVHSNGAYFARYQVFAYNNVTDTHTPVAIPATADNLLRWFNRNIAGRIERSHLEHAVYNLVMLNLNIEKLIAVKLQSWRDAESCNNWCGGQRIKPLAIAERFVFVKDLDEAVLVKMGFNPSPEVVELYGEPPKV